MRHKATRSRPSNSTGQANGTTSSRTGKAQEVELLVDADEANPTGGATSEEIAEVALESFGEDSALEVSEPQLAIESLVRVVASRLEHREATNDPKALAIFIFSNRSRDLGNKLGARYEPVLNNGALPLTGRLWVTAPTMKSGHYVDLKNARTAEIFQEVCDKGAGDLAALVFDPSAAQPEIRYYPNGLSDADRVQQFLVSERTFSWDAFEQALTLFYKSSIITPDAATSAMSPWKNGNKHIPRPEAEAFLQAWLKSVLSVAFRGGCVVQWEVRGTEGRCDLLVISRQPNRRHTWTRHVALELKVLRSFTSRGQAVAQATIGKAIKKGLGQAVAYMKEQSAQYGMLCCYDMRAPKQHDGDECFTPIMKDAKKHKIQLRRYRLFGSSDEKRLENISPA